MLKKPELQQPELELVSIGALVPEKHLLRKVDQTVDFGFIRDRGKHLCCEDKGRPGIDPVVLFRLLLLGYLYGVRSKRQLMREADSPAETDAKQLHGHRYARMRSLHKVPCSPPPLRTSRFTSGSLTESCYLGCTAANRKSASYSPSSSLHLFISCIRPGFGSFWRERLLPPRPVGEK